MKADVVVDIGNSRMKWGLVTDTQSTLDQTRPISVQAMAVLPLNDPSAWQEQRAQWQLFGAVSWAIASVNPKAKSQFIEWLDGRRSRGEVGQVASLEQSMRLPITMHVKEPGRVGVDRLFNAMAAKDRIKRPLSILIIDAGSAVTVDWVNEHGGFCGGVIFPGCRLMAKALHDYTAALPLVSVDRINPPIPGNSTEGAIQAGVFWAVAGGIKAVVRQLAARARFNQECAHDPVVFLTGGDAELVEAVMDSWVIVWPEMTLEGIRIAAEALP